MGKPEDVKVRLSGPAVVGKSTKAPRPGFEISPEEAAVVCPYCNLRLRNIRRKLRAVHIEACVNNPAKRFCYSCSSRRGLQCLTLEQSIDPQNTKCPHWIWRGPEC